MPHIIVEMYPLILFNLFILYIYDVLRRNRQSLLIFNYTCQRPRKFIIPMVKFIDVLYRYS